MSQLGLGASLFAGPEKAGKAARARVEVVKPNPRAAELEHEEPKAGEPYLVACPLTPTGSMDAIRVAAEAWEAPSARLARHFGRDVGVYSVSEAGAWQILHRVDREGLVERGGRLEWQAGARRDGETDGAIPAKAEIPAIVELGDIDDEVL